MKSWFAKLRISAALDGRRKLPARWVERPGRSHELHDFEQEIVALDHALKMTAPEPQAPDWLHRSIMRAVQVAERPAEAQPRLGVLCRLAAPALALVALLAAWQAVRGPVRPTMQATQSLTAAAGALEMSGQMTRLVPSAVVAPLSEELGRLNCDLDNTAKFLLASLP
jgi:hypothetical protein